jgi:DNA-binding NarL/FixJ family response regulator
MTIRILLADDHKLMREGLRTLIAEQTNMSVIAEADEGGAAIRLAAALSPDIVIMDISMPGLNGIEATRGIKAANPSVEVIALSMHLDKRMVLEMLGAGAAGYLLKDCAFDEVIFAINSVFAGSGYISPRAAEVVLKDYAGRVQQRELLPLPDLPKKEQQLLRLLAKGRTTAETASLLNSTVKTVETDSLRLVLERVAPYLIRASAKAMQEQDASLTAREMEILAWVKEGKNNWEIASILNITPDTVKFHLKNIFQKLNVTNRSQALTVALERKLIDL